MPFSLKLPSKATFKMPDIANQSRTTKANESSKPSDASRGNASQGPQSALPPFLRQTKLDVHNKFEDLEWKQRHRLAQGLLMNPVSPEFSRPSGDDVNQRNRYINIDPYTNNRVKLKVPEGHSDYINASPIVLKSSRGDTKTYIATQGPKELSLGHLWRMIWHETKTVAVIIMLTQTHEAGKEKCFPYYPTDISEPRISVNSHDEFGDGFRVTVELVESSYDTPSRSTVRKLRLSSGAETKTVWHCLFGGWPDFYVPEEEDRTALLQLVRLSKVRNTDPGNARVVHCSAGVGRSGTFIALDYLLDELAEGALDDVPEGSDRIAETVDALRKQRMMMVQGEPQFHFLYDVLREQWLARHSGAKPSGSL